MKGTTLLHNERRYAIVPQMRDYDTLEEKAWLPYVMTFQQPWLSTPSFSTDEHGFRRTWWKEKPLSWADYNSASSSPRAALIGTSTAFGVGASSDAATLASFLNRQEKKIWFNFAGRAFNSTQELLIFLLFLPSSVDTVLIFSGINNLVLSHLSSWTSPVYNSFYAQSAFERGLKSGEVAGVRGSLRLFLEEISHKLAPMSNGKDPGSPAERYEHMRVCFRRDMRLWVTLSRGMNFRLCFVFQPIAPWIRKELTSEEREVFSILDECDPDSSWGEVSTYLRGHEERYRSDVRTVCDELGIPFLDMNQCAPFTQPNWLFVDRAHLTDEGYALAAEEIRKRFGL